MTSLDEGKIVHVPGASVSHPKMCVFFFFTRVTVLSSEVALMTQIHAMKSQASEPSRWSLALHLQKSKKLWNVTSTPCVLLHRAVFRYSGNFTAVYLKEVLCELFLMSSRRLFNLIY